MGIFEIFKKNDNKVGEKLAALVRISNDGHSNLICSVIPFLKDTNKEIQDKACEIAISLFRKIDSKNGFYDTLKYCDISIADIDYFEKTFPQEIFIELLAICSFNKSGYIREKAVKKLAETKDAKAIPFIIYRLADWVQPVRQVALNKLENFKTTVSLNALIENLPLFEWLQKVERTNLSEIYKNITGFITHDNRQYVVETFTSYSDKLRLLLAKHLSKSFSGDLIELKLFLNDKHFLIRNLALEYFNLLNPNDIAALLKDKSGKIRLQTLYKLKGITDFNHVIANFVADDTVTIRHFARYNAKSQITDFGEVYHENLVNHQQIIGSLLGLAEVNAKEHWEIVKDFLNNSKIKVRKVAKIKVRKVAFIALTKLNEEEAYRYALNNLDCEYSSFRNLMVDFLSKISRKEVLMAARKCFNTENFEIKKSMLRLFNNIGGWAIISDLMLGTVDPDERIRNLSHEYVLHWKVRAARLFTIPQQEDIERARKIFEFANEIHESKNYFRINPLNELDFYFR